MNASTIVMALTEHVSEGSNYRQGQALAASWPILLSPDTELATLYNEMKRLRKGNTYSTFLYKTSDGAIMGQLMYYAELNCPEQTNAILDLESSRFVLDTAVTQVKAFDALLHTEVYPRIQERIANKVAGYKELKVLSINGTRGKDSKLGCKIFMNSNNRDYTVERFLKDLDTIPTQSWDLVVNHYSHKNMTAPTETLVLNIPVKSWQSGKVISKKLMEEIRNAQLIPDKQQSGYKPEEEPFKVVFRVRSDIKNNVLELRLTNLAVDIHMEYSGVPAGVKEKMQVEAHQEIEQHLAGSIPSVIRIKGAQYLFEDKSYHGVDYDKIEKTIQQILSQEV
jgi:hypothetical protein